MLARAVQAPAEEMAVLYKYRGDVRVNLGKLTQGREDYSAGLAALADSDPSSDTVCIGSTQVTVSRYAGADETGVADYCVYIPSSSDLLLRRARVLMLQGLGFRV